MRCTAVIGASGCVGRQICDLFARRGHHIVAIARNRAAHVAGYDFIPLDVAATDPTDLAALFAARGVGVVVNAAGRWGPTEVEMVHSHLGVVRCLVTASALLDHRLRLVHFGSVHEYGPVPAGTSLDESVEPRPSNMYSLTKLDASTAVLAAGGVVLRAANMFGPYPPEETFFAGLLQRLRAAERSDEIVELAVADARRDFLDVRDAARAALLASEAPVAGRVFNIGSGVAADLRQVVMSFLAAARFPLDRLRLADRDVPSHGGQWIQVDSGLARRLLGWSPGVTAEESLRAMWDAGRTTGQLISTSGT
jgi:nucleoside-diphosphate-sugar epimerase